LDPSSTLRTTRNALVWVDNSAFFESEARDCYKIFRLCQHFWRPKSKVFAFF